MRWTQTVVFYCLIVYSISMPVYSAGPLAVFDSSPVTYKTSEFPLSYSSDMGDLGTFSHDTAVALVDECFLVWENVPTATIQFTNAGQILEDIDATNYTDYMNNYTDDINPIIFDDDGSIIDAEYGYGSSEVVLGFAGSAYVNNHYLEGVAVLNGALSRYFTYEQFKATFVHEFGHFIGLDHCQINLRYVGDGNTENDKYVPTMFPTATDDDTTLGSLNPDDEASLSLLYPAADVDTYYGTISGFVVSESGLPVFGANVVAVKQGDEQMSRFSCVSDYLEQGTGAFDIPVTPGTYRVYIEPIHSAFTGGSGVGPYTSSGSDLSFINPVTTQYYDHTITVSAGERVSNITIGGSSSGSTTSSAATSSTSSAPPATTSIPETTTTSIAQTSTTTVVVPHTSTTTTVSLTDNSTTTTVSDSRCPADTPVECVDETRGVYWCCPAEQPICGTGDNWGTCRPDSCPAEAAADHDTKTLALLRDFRDRVLAGCTEGNELIDLYYAHSAEVLHIISADGRLRRLCASTLRALLPAVRERIAGDIGYVDDAMLRQLRQLCSAVAREASPRLAADILSFYTKLTDKDLPAELGFISTKSGSPEKGLSP